MSARGVTLVELLVVLAFVVALAGALFAAMSPVRAAVERSLVAVDVGAGPRAALERILTDVRNAGGAVAVAPADVELARVWAVVALAASLNSTLPQNPAQALRITHAPSGGAQARLAQPALAGESVLQLQTAVRCTGGPPACSFSAGDHALIFDGSAAHAVRVAGAGSGVLWLEAPLAASFDADAVVARVTFTRYGLRESGGETRLVRISDGAAEQPVLDSVAGFDVSGDHTDPLQVRFLAIRLRVEAPSPDWRGPAGWLFVRGGRASHPRQWIPDVELRTTIALRHASGAPL